METSTLANLFKTIHEKQTEERKRKLIETMGILRGGNTGIYAPGERPSHCLRKSALRTFFGIEPEVEEAKRLVFDNGLNSEQKLVEDWALTLERGQRILTQQEAGTLWKTSNGTAVSGSPDIVVVDALSKPLYLVEAKNMNSVFKAGKILKEIPAVEALAQAVHYAYILGKIPGHLIYSSHTQFHNIDKMLWFFSEVLKKARFRHLFDWGDRPIWDKPKSPNRVEIGREEYPKSLLGFRMGFSFRWAQVEGEWIVQLKFGGLLPDGGHPDNLPGQWVNTIVTWPLILGYYEHLSKAKSDPNWWAPPPIDLHIDGSTGSFDVCDGYCEYGPICKKLNKNKAANIQMMVKAIEELG